MNDVKITYLDKIIHEINNYIQTIGFNSDMLLDNKVVFSEEDKKFNLQQIQDAAGKLTRVVNMLTLVTNLKTDALPIKHEELDLIELVRKEVSYYQKRNRRNLDFRIEFNNQIQSCKTRADGLWLEQLIANLLLNAINHAAKGLIEVAANIINKDGTDYFNLTVSDEGDGIPESELESIFHPLKRGKNSIGKTAGSGVGLAVAREVAEAHGGSISAGNNPKGGAIFQVLLPLKGLSN